ncbi:MAG TPA: RNA polymerase sigma factor [Candidatus Kapabacteria bacterium]|jgi:RNA polymerase sigma-70 factor (ECF subfamily)
MSISDEDARFWELIEQERHRTWRLCRALTRSYDDASDLMSDTVLAAYQSFPSLREPGAFRWFLSTIAVRIQRRKRWRSRIFVSLDEARRIAWESTQESSYDLEVLIRSLEQLPAREREALVLFEISGLSIKEIQGIQGGTISGVKSRMNRARQKLHTMVASDAPSAFRTPPKSLLPTHIRLQEL